MLERRIVQVKLLTDDKAVLKEGVKIAEKVEGVVSVSARDGVIFAEIGEWASDYDVMVAIINGVAETLNVEAEPFADDDMPADVIEKSEAVGNNYDSEQGCDEEISSGENADEKSNEEESNPKKEWIFKISEWGVALVLFIVGLILAGGEKSYKAAPYLQILAFTVAGYEVCFSMLSKMFKKNFVSEEGFITLTAIASVALQKYEYAAAFMIIYGGLQVAIDGVKYFAFKGDTQYFLKAADDKKIRKISNIYLIAVFVAAMVYAFVSPAFFEVYKSALKSSGAVAVLLAVALCPFSLSAVRAVTTAFALKKVDDTGVKIYENAFNRLQKTDCVLFDINAAKSGGEITPDLDGAVMELYDGGIKNVELLSDGDKSYASELRKTLNMRKSASMLTLDGKIEEIKLNGGKHNSAVYVTAENNGVFGTGAAGVTVGLGEADGDVKIADKDVKKIPYIVKLAKRTRKLKIISAVISAVVKAALLALIFTKFTDNAYLVCGLSAAASAVGLVISLINRTEAN